MKLKAEFFIYRALVGVGGTAILITNATSRNLAASNYLTNSVTTNTCPLLCLNEIINLYMADKGLSLARLHTV